MMRGLVPFNHREDMDLFKLMDEMEKSFFRDWDEAFSFRTDIVDKGDHYLLQAELPGFSKEEIQVETQDDVITIRAEHKEEDAQKKHRFLRRERRYGLYERSFQAPGIKKEGISAAYKHGVLELTLPKQEEKPALPAARRVEIE